MNKIFKISIIICSFLIVLGITNFALAAGKGYFLEVSNFVMFYNNLRVNGYLVIEDTLTDRAGKLGDLLVDDTFNLDRDSVVYFCKDQRDIGTNTPQNTDCVFKDILWDVQPDGNDYNSVLTITNNNLYQLTTDHILANGAINLVPGAGTRVTTEDSMRVTGCLVNDGSGTCGGSQLKTNKVYLNDLNFISKCTAGENLNKMCNNDQECGVNGRCNYTVRLNPDVLEMGIIDLGDESNFKNQNVCYKIGHNQNCTGSIAIIGESWTFHNQNFIGGDGGTYGCYSTSSSICVNGARLCCFLDILNW